jgi:hypothetical protein
MLAILLCMQQVGFAVNALHDLVKPTACSKSCAGQNNSMQQIMCWPTQLTFWSNTQHAADKRAGQQSSPSGEKHSMQQTHMLVNAPHLLVKHAACHQLAVINGAANLAHHADVAQVQPAQQR